MGAWVLGLAVHTRGSAKQPDLLSGAPSPLRHADTAFWSKTVAGVPSLPPPPRRAQAGGSLPPAPFPEIFPAHRSQEEDLLIALSAPNPSRSTVVNGAG